MEKSEVIKKLGEIADRILENSDNFETIDDLLDERDDESFSEDWEKEYENVEEIKDEEKNKALIDQYREIIFKKVFTISNSSDLSSYVSDDFALLMDAVNSDYESNWLNALLQNYINGVIPKGKLDSKDGKLSLIIKSSF